MTLQDTIQSLERIALTQPNIRYAGEGDLYRDLNANPSIKYGVFYITQNRHYSDEALGVDRYGFNLFYIDRLVNDNGDNALQVQSIGKEALTNIIRMFCERYDAEVYGTIEWQAFTQKFSDLCAGVYAVINIEISQETQCVD